MTLILKIKNDCVCCRLLFCRQQKRRHLYFTNLVLFGNKDKKTFRTMRLYRISDDAFFYSFKIAAAISYKLTISILDFCSQLAILCEFS